MKNDHRRDDNRGNRERNRKPYGENRFDGPGRRTYGDRPEREDRPHRNNAPRVGRIADDVPQARRVTGNRDYRSAGREAFDRDFGRKPYRGNDLHRGGADRSPSGPADRSHRRRIVS